MSPKTELSNFLQNIWGTGGKVFLAWKSDSNSFDVPAAKNWPEDKEKILEFFLTASAKGKDVYFSPAIYKDTSINKEKSNVLKSKVVWVDFDGNAAEGTALLADAKLPQPTYRLQSSKTGHEHWYWALDSYKPVEVFELINKKLAYALKADRACWDAGRVLRPPFTTNNKKGESRPVDIIEFNKIKYTPEQFSELPSVNSSIIDKTIELGEIPSIGMVLGKYQWDDRHLDIFYNPPMEKGKGRSDSLVRLAYFCAEAGMPDEAIYAVISDVDSRIKKFVGRADRDRRLAEIIGKARVKYPFGGSTMFSTDEDIQQVFTINELLRSEFNIEWLVEDLLIKRTINFLSAESGIGKSRLSLQMAEALASGSTFLQWPVPQKIKTMYLSLEMDAFMMKHFAESLSNKTEYDEEVAENFLIVPVGNAINLASEAGIRYIKALHEQYKPEVMIIDALGSLTFEKLEELEAKGINNVLKALISEFETTFIIIHHNVKGERNSKTPPVLQDIYGSQYVVTDAAMVWTMWRPDPTDDSHVELHTVKSRAQKRMAPIEMDGTTSFHFLLKEPREKDDDPNAGFGFKA